MAFEIGRRVLTEAIVLTRERTVAYAQAFDPQPAHVDEAAAVDSAFGELVASGWQTAALSMRLAEAAVGPIADRACVIESLKWLRPVRPGDTLRVAVEMVEQAGDGRLRFRIETLDDVGETLQMMIGTVQG